MRLSDVKLGKKLTVFILLVGIVPLLLSAMVSYWQAGGALGDAESQASTSLEEQSFAQLVALRDVKKHQTEEYFQRCQNDLATVGSTLAGFTGKELTEKHQRFLAKFNEQYGYYDLFVIAPDGDCFFTVCHEADYQTNLVDGKYGNSNLGKLVQQVLRTKKSGFADFEPYAPSNGDPASFIAKPLTAKDGSVRAVVALQMPLDTVNATMGARAVGPLS